MILASSTIVPFMIYVQMADLIGFNFNALIREVQQRKPDLV